MVFDLLGVDNGLGCIAMASVSRGAIAYVPVGMCKFVLLGRSILSISIYSVWHFILFKHLTQIDT
jgi:hypothetical protein